MAKRKLAIYWAASCGGCDIAILDLETYLLDVAAVFDIVLWPVATDFKYADVEALEDGAIDLTLFNGAIRTDENERLAVLLRRKSKLLVGFGACAIHGGIPALANEFPVDEVLARVYATGDATVNTERVKPASSHVAEGELELPVLQSAVRALADVVPVDYFVPGCPPQTPQIKAVLEAIVSGAELPPRGAMLGAGDTTCCQECARTRVEKRLAKIVRPHEIVPDATQCLLDQGLVCMGPATRSGCGALCPASGIPCRGCYGPPPGVRDQGAKMLGALASVIDAQEPDQIEQILAGLVDPVGTFYRFGIPPGEARFAEARARTGAVGAGAAS